MGCLAAIFHMTYRGEKVDCRGIVPHPMGRQSCSWFTATGSCRRHAFSMVPSTGMTSRGIALLDGLSTGTWGAEEVPHETI